MKFFICFALIAIAANYVSAGPISASGSSSGGSAAGANQEAEADGQQSAQQVSLQQAIDLTRLRKSAYGGGAAGGYGGSSIPAPPCPKNYLFSCQPNLSPVACSAPAPSYGSAGAYSAPVPTYVAPLPRNLGVGVPQPIGYNPQQYYQY